MGECLLLFFECKWGGGYPWRWWGSLNTTHCNQNYLNFLCSQVVGAQKPSLDCLTPLVLTLTLTPLTSLYTPCIPWQDKGTRQGCKMWVQGVLGCRTWVWKIVTGCNRCKTRVQGVKDMVMRVQGVHEMGASGARHGMRDARHGHKRCE